MPINKLSDLYADATTVHSLKQDIRWIGPHNSQSPRDLFASGDKEIAKHTAGV